MRSNPPRVNDVTNEAVLDPQTTVANRSATPVFVHVIVALVSPPGDVNLHRCHDPALALPFFVSAKTGAAIAKAMNQTIRAFFEKL